MILEKLIQYSKNLEDRAPKMYAPRTLNWIIDIDIQGNFQGIIPTSGKETGKKASGIKKILPHILRSGRNFSAKLLSDNAEYVLGFLLPDDKNIEKKKKDAEEKHANFVKLIRECAQNTGCPEVEAVVKFFEKYNIEKLDLPEDLKPGDEITFRVNDSIFPYNLTEVQNFWTDKFFLKEETDEEEHFTCIVCGKYCKPLKSHPKLIKKIPGGQMSGVAIVSANSPAFESFNLKSSNIAPTCINCAEEYATALNHLISLDDSTLMVGKVRYVFWTISPVDFSPVSFLSQPDPKQVQSLIDSARIGKAHNLEIDETLFYACSLSGSGGRCVIRDWIETTIGNVKQSLARWFKLQSIINWDGTEGSLLGLFPLASSLFDKPENIIPNVPKILLASAIKGIPLPLDLLFLASKRNHAEQKMTRPRAAIIKAVLLSNNYFTNERDDYMYELEMENKEPAYLCGRLMAVLEDLQKSAIEGVKSTITDRFLGTASTCPAMVFPRLLRGAQAHLSILKRDNEPAYIATEKRIQEVMSNLEKFPKTLTLEQQGLFSLGYYHQKAARWRSTTKDQDKTTNIEN